MSGIMIILRWAVLIIGLMVGLVWVFNSPPPEYRLAALLRLPTLPSSVSDVQCWSRGIEDDHTQCTGVALVEDMRRLMKGFPFQVMQSPRLPPGRKSASCRSFPERQEIATRCYIYRSPELGQWGPDGPFGYMAFNYDEHTGRFHTETVRP